MSRTRFVVLALPLLAFALTGCDFGRAERARAEAERMHAEEDRHRTEAERARAEAELQAVRAENANLRAELEEARKLSGRDVAQDDWLEQTGDFGSIDGQGTFVISYRRVYARVPELIVTRGPAPKAENDWAEFRYTITDRRTDGFTVTVDKANGAPDGFAKVAKGYKWVAKGVPVPRK